MINQAIYTFNSLETRTVSRPYHYRSKANAERAAEWMRKLNANPAFAKANAERATERIRKLNADPAFARANAERAAERMRKLNANPAFAKANAERAAERMRRRHADPAFNPLAGLSRGQRKIYNKLRSAQVDRHESLAEAKRCPP